MSETSTREKLNSNDVLFLIGLGLFIFYLYFKHPYTQGLEYSALALWMALSALTISMAPDYYTKEAKENIKPKGLKKVIEKLIKESRSISLILGSLLVGLGGFFYLINNFYLLQVSLGIAYGFFMKFILT